MVTYNEDDKVAGLFTSQDLLSSEDGTKIGESKDKIREKYGEPLDAIKKGNTYYELPNQDIADLYKIDHRYVLFFYDTIEDDELYAIQIIEEDFEKSKEKLYGKPTKELKEGYEKQLFDLINVTRYNFDLPVYEWDDDTYPASEYHSKDMAENDFFDHVNNEGVNTDDRLDNLNVKYRMYGENVAEGQVNGIYAHLALFNSQDHRDNTLQEKFETLSTGVGFKEDGTPLYTELYVEPPLF